MTTFAVLRRTFISKQHFTDAAEKTLNNISLLNISDQEND